MQAEGFSEKRDRSKKLELVKVEVHGKRRWLLNGHYINGVRARKYFPTKEEGLRFIDEVRDRSKHLGERAASVPGWLHEQALEAHEILSAHGISIVDAAKLVAAQTKQRNESVTFASAAKQFLESRRQKGRSTVHLQDIRFRAAKFEMAFGTKLVSDIKTSEIDGWLERLKLSPVSINNYRRILHCVFEFARSRGWLKANPVSSIDEVTTVSTPPEVLKVGELRQLFCCLTENEVPFVAIGAFAGLRTAELKRLKWEDVDFDRRLIKVPAHASKTASRRLVKMHDNLFSWLSPHKGRSGLITSTNFRKRMEECLRRAGFGRPGTESDKEKSQGITLKAWPHNGLRHSFASYHLAKWNDAAATALELGHATTKLLFQHYRELVVPQDAVEYWEISRSASLLPE